MNQKIWSTVQNALNQLEMPVLVYDSYMAFKID